MRRSSTLTENENLHRGECAHAVSNHAQMCVAEVLQGCHANVVGVPHVCCRGTTECCRGAIRVLQGCHRSVAGMPQGCCMGATWVPHGCHRGATGVPQGCYSAESCRSQVPRESCAVGMSDDWRGDRSRGQGWCTWGGESQLRCRQCRNVERREGLSGCTYNASGCTYNAPGCTYNAPTTHQDAPSCRYNQAHNRDNGSKTYLQLTIVHLSPHHPCRVGFGCPST
jgi:hypothetical protein